DDEARLERLGRFRSLVERDRELGVALLVGRGQIRQRLLGRPRRLVAVLVGPGAELIAREAGPRRHRLDAEIALEIEPAGGRAVEVAAVDRDVDRRALDDAGRR